MNMTPNKRAKLITGCIFGAIVLLAVVVSICLATLTNTNAPKIKILSCPEKVYFIDADYQSKNAFIIKSAYVYDDGDIEETAGTISYNFVKGSDAELLSIDSTGKIEVKFDAFSRESNYQPAKDDVIKVEIIVSSALKGVDDVRHTINVVRKNDYTIKLDVNGGNLLGIDPAVPVPAWDGQAVNLDNPTLENYTFDGWYVVGVGDKTYNYDEVKFFSEDIYYWGNNISLRARYKTNVELGLDGIDADVEAEGLDDVYFNEALSSEHIRVLNLDIGKLEVQGWSLRGWFTGTGGTGDENGVKNGVFCATKPTLYAKWCGTAKLILTDIIKNDENKDIIEREGTVGSLSANAVTDIPVVYKGAIQLNNSQIPVYPDGGSFGGWYTELYGAGTEITDANGVGEYCSTNLKLYDKINFIVKINYNSATGDFNEDKKSFIIPYGAIVDLVSNGLGRNPTKTGWNFSHWDIQYDKHNFSIPLNKQYTLLKDITITAKWKWEFDLNACIEDYVLLKKTETIYFGEEKTFDSLDDWGSWEFDGWYTQQSGAGECIKISTDYNNTGDRMLYAKWILPKLTLNTLTPKINEYRVIEHANIVYGKTIENSLGYVLPIPETPNGYNNGLGWYSGIDNSAERITNTKINYPKIMDVLYYKWAPKTYTITLNHDGGSNGYDSTITATMGENLPDLTQYLPTKYSYTFLGYYYSSYDNLYYSAAMTGCKEWDNYESDTFQLTALWGNPCEVTLDPVIPFSSNYDDSDGSAIVKVRLGATMPSGYSAPKRAGYTFSGFYEYKDGKGRQYYDENMQHIDGVVWEKDVETATIYAYWTNNPIKVSTDSSSLSMTDANSVASTTIKASNGSGKYKYSIISTNHPNLKTCNVDNSSGLLTLTSNNNENNSGEVTIRTQDVRTGAYSDKKVSYKTNYKDHGSCFIAGTLITMGDGTTKPVEELRLGDTILSYNHFSGKYESASISLLFNMEINNYPVLNLSFANGDDLKVVNMHGLFDCELNKYVMLDYDNAENYIGHSFVCVEYVNGIAVTYKTKLLSATITYETTTRYSLVSACNINHIANNILAVTDEAEGLYNVFEFGDNMQYTEESINADIEKYGLTDYSEWSKYVTYEEFVAFGGQYLNIAFAKNLTTKEKLIELIYKYLYNYGRV